MKYDEVKGLVPKAVLEQDGIRGTDGELIDTVKRIRKSPTKGSKNRHHIYNTIVKGYEYVYHATKGWRKRKAD